LGPVARHPVWHLSTFQHQPDPETVSARWTARCFCKHARGRCGPTEQLLSVFSPYPSFTGITGRDARGESRPILFLRSPQCTGNRRTTCPSHFSLRFLKPGWTVVSSPPGRSVGRLFNSIPIPRASVLSIIAGLSLSCALALRCECHTPPISPRAPRIAGQRACRAAVLGRRSHRPQHKAGPPIRDRQMGKRMNFVLALGRTAPTPGAEQGPGRMRRPYDDGLISQRQRPRAIAEYLFATSTNRPLRGPESPRQCSLQAHLIFALLPLSSPDLRADL